jgi:hypothetical protein
LADCQYRRDCQKIAKIAGIAKIENPALLNFTASWVARLTNPAPRHG